MVPRAVEPSQYGSLFEILKDYNLPTAAEKVEIGRYIVPHDLQRRWKLFEEQIGAVLGAMFEHSHIEGAQVLSMPTPEQMGGYTRIHKSEKVALRQAYGSRQWFLVHLGTLLYSCMRAWTLRATSGGRQVAVHRRDFPTAQMTQERSGEHIEPLKFLPLWFIRVAAVRRDLVPFLSLLRFTFSNFLSFVSHVGMFFRIQDILELGNLGFFIEHRVPISYPWGDAEEEYVRAHPHAACYRPPLALIQAAIAKKQQEATERDEVGQSSLTVDGNVDTAPGNVVTHRPPTPSTITPGIENHQLGVTIQEFFKIRAAVARGRPEIETSEQRQERVLRRQAPTRNTALFYWRANSNGDMIRLQIASRWRAVLEAPDSRYQRRYDPWDDVVDYAEDFDPKPTNTASQPIDPLPTADLAHLDNEIREAYLRRIPPIEGPELREEDWMDDSVIDVASIRFGFIVTPDKTRATLDHANSLYSRVHESLQLYRDTSTVLVCPSDVRPFVETLEAFLNAFKPQKREGRETETNGLQSPGCKLWDLHPDATALRKTQSVKDLVRLDGNHILLGKAEGCPWWLVLSNDVDALHACRLREAGFSVRKVALHFLDRGIPFRAMVPSNQIQTAHIRSQHLAPSAIEVRLEGYKWALSDYREYCRLRRATLLRPGAAFAALQQGGIVWRIAREELGKLPVAAFESGPDLSGAVDVSSDVAGWLDNKPTSETVAAICGVYHVPLG